MLKSSRSKLLPTLFLLVFFVYLFGQSGNVAINSDGSSPDSSAVLDLKSSTQGLLIPRLNTDERNAIANPKVGLEIYNLDLDCFEYYNGVNWLTNCGFLNDPTMAMAGTTRFTVNDTVHLNANNPKVSESGLWSILSGQGGTFSDITDPQAIFSNNGNFETFLLRWTISNPCGKTYSDVAITFNREGIYVSVNGSDTSGDGLPENPYKSIQKGIDEAIILTQSDVFISEGDFTETLILNNISNINLLGGHYAFDWNIRDVNIHKTRIQGSETACSISNSNNLIFSRIYLTSKRSNTGNSIGVDLLNATNVLFENCKITSENAAKGNLGNIGSPGIDGEDGENFQPSGSNPTLGGSGGNGGSLTANGISLDGGSAGSGGNGTTVDGPGDNGVPGAQGSPSGGSGGSGGPGIGPCTNGICSTGGNNPDGGNGAEGANGNNGLSGTGGAFSSNGLDGVNGSGGGGGGGGGGLGRFNSPSTPGNSGAGGGGGGSGASAGIGGTKGYSSFGLWVKNSTVQIVNSNVITGHAGNGGNGGNGAQGGLGGEGGNGGLSVSFSGKGGNGGDGGNSGAGGGGGGGSSICILMDASSSLTESGNIFQPGPFGQGGESLGNSGQDGTSENLVTY